MRSFLERVSSRKFLTALAVQVAAVAALFLPEHQSALEAGAVRVAALLTLLLAAMGYGRIESAVDAAAAGETLDPAASSDAPGDGDFADSPDDSDLLP